jgi:hypothetical protein
MHESRRRQAEREIATIYFLSRHTFVVPNISS